MMRWLVVVMAGLAACSSAGVPPKPRAPQPQPQPRPQPQPVAGPMRVAFGACSGAQTHWISGPRPRPAATETTPQPGGFASLTGTGAIGAGWGTIGSGARPQTGTRYGVIGYGGQEDRSAAVPSVSLGQPTVLGELAKKTIRLHVKRETPQIQYCYEKQLLAKPGIQGTIATQFYIAPSGEVASAAARGVDPEVARCIAGVIKSIRFPRPKGGGGVQVSYPVTLRSGEAISKPEPATGSLDFAVIRHIIQRSTQKFEDCYEKQLLAKPHLHGTIHTRFYITPSGKVAGATGSGFDPEVASCVAGVLEGLQFPEPKGGADLIVNYPFVFREADVSRSKPPATAAAPAAAAEGSPITTNPLRALSPELAACLRQNPVPDGAVVVELHYDQANTVRAANVYGLDGAAARACVVGIAKRVVRPADAPATQRCALAFGQMPASALPAIDVTDRGITFRGSARPAPPAGSIDSPIDALVAELAAHRRAALAPNGPVVSIDGPLVVRPADATSIEMVYEALDRMRAVDQDVVLAARRDAGWRLLRADLALPVAPVPLGPDGRSMPMTQPPQAASAVELSVFVAKGGVWVGVSRVNELQQIARGPNAAAELAKALHEHKVSAFFADRTDLEIGAEDGVPYADVVSVIDAATAAGFTDWRLVRPDALSARPTP